MAKTRSQTGNISVKKEEDVKPTLVLNGVSNTRSSSRIAKKKSSITNNRRVPAQQVKVEQDTDTKSLLQPPPNSSKVAKSRMISQAQINQLIGYIVNDSMAIVHASRKANISVSSGTYYYREYNKDPEKRIPLPRGQAPKKYTQEQIGNLIRCINDDKMTISEASAKLNMTFDSGKYYYAKYLKDPNRAIPVVRLHQHYTQDQKNEFIGYIINDKMTIKAASEKAKMNVARASRYYHNYFKVQNPDIATPSHIPSTTPYTQEKIKEIISYIVDDKMSIYAASRKANASDRSARIHYRRYLKDNNMEIPVFKKTYTQDKINALIGYFIDDKMSINAASKKANISYGKAKTYIQKYLKDHHPDWPTKKYITQEQKSEFIGYIVVDKMSINAASKKANIRYNTGKVYYRQYLKDHHLDVPTLKVITQDQKNKLIGYIGHDKISIRAASKKANMSAFAGFKYYHQYLKDHNIDCSIRKVITQEQKSEFIGYIVHDKMSIKAASKKANMSTFSGSNVYHKYLKEHNIGYSIRKVITQEQKSEFIGYIVHEKMSIKAASKKANMCQATGYKYYRQYLKNQKRDIPT